jgi:putative protease
LNPLPPELLAPAGTPDAAWAALAYGADAVYAGLPRFSARAEAGNFTAEALDELIGYAHHLGRRVNITFNTLVQQRELGEALDALALIRDLNADGVIVQDLGVARLVLENFPQIRLHASTQLAAHNLAGARQLAALGFKRVVLARELSLDAIEHISRNCGIETEAFIHGALCYSYSGLCLFSSHLLGRSGNRGRCAYSCRQAFECGAQKNLPFSMKDFSAADHLPKLVEAGVASLKIEGRMKSPHYVAAVTDFYRKLLEGDTANSAQRLADIQTIFGRPSTGLYLTGEEEFPIDPVNAGHHGALIGTVEEIRRGGWLVFKSNRVLQKHDGLKVETPGDTFAYGFAANDLRLLSDPETKRRFELPADTPIAVRLPSDAPHIQNGTLIYCSISQEVRQRYDFSAPRPGTWRQRRPVDIRVFQCPEKITFTASAGGVQAELVLPGPFEEARQPDKAAASFRQSFEKLGDTGWRLGELSLEGPALFLPVSVLNDARRRLIDDFSNHWKKSRRNFQPLEKLPDAPACSELFWSVKSRSFQPLEHIDEFVLEIDPARPGEIEKAVAFYAGKLRLALPVIIRDEDIPAYQELISQSRPGVPVDPNERDARSAFSTWEAANVGGLNLLNGKQDITADWPLYTLNTQAAVEWRTQGVRRFVLSPEDDAQNWFALIEQLGDAAIVPVYQYTPLMTSATRPAIDGDQLTDRSRREFRVEQHGREFVLTGTTPFSLTEHLPELKARGACRFRIDLTCGPAESGDLVERILSGEFIPGHSGNFSRGLQ